MRPAFESPSSYQPQASWRSRSVSFLISLAILLLLIWGMIRLGLVPVLEKQQTSLPITLDLGPGHSAQASHTKAASKNKSAAKQRTKATPPPAKAASTPKPPAPPVPWNVIPMSHDEFTSSDISTKPNRSQQTASADASAQQSGDTDGGEASNGAGTGPGGQKLFKADWYPRPPTEAEMDFYMPHKNNGGVGWGEIACKTVPNYKVEDCQPLGESPGSGYARALVDASWQFHVLPPRVGGRPMVGSWVRIHFDFYPK